MSKKIGVIDSGIGGTSLLFELLERSFNADYFYLSDSKNVPYGGKSQDFMLERMELMLASLPELDACVIACNTLTAQTIEKLREKAKFQIFGIEPYINYINHRVNKTEKVALIATVATAHSERFKALVEKYDPTHEVEIFPLADLAMLIENYKNIDWKKIDEELSVLMNRNIDKLILGCTHYPLIKKHIESYLDLNTIDPNGAVVNHIANILKLEKGQSQAFFRFNFEDSWQGDILLPLIEDTYE